MAITSCLSSSTLLHSPEQWRRNFFCLSSRNQRVRTRPSISIALRASAADGAQLTENKKEDKEEEEKALQQRLQALTSSMVLPANFLSQLPNDLRSDEYANDTLLFLHYTPDVLDMICYALERFCVASGARINWDKSYGILAGGVGCFSRAAVLSRHASYEEKAVLLVDLASFYGWPCVGGQLGSCFCLLKDAAFVLANGPVKRECGEVIGEKLLQLSVAWEQGDTQAATLAMEELQYALPREPLLRNAIGKRLIGAGRRFAGTGSYAKGELQKIAKALTVAGEAMQSADETETKEEPELQTTRMYKFGDLQVEFTSQKCFIGSIIALGFGALSWGLATSVQAIPDSASQHAVDNATLLATTLKGAFLLLGYGCTLLSGFAAIGLLGLGLQLSAKSSTEK
ncbi:hypothetical protein L7F22_033963 [Adiantum nelumboides]|nr:hypothetical protein [Adiantum nelumboides]